MFIFQIWNFTNFSTVLKISMIFIKRAAISVFRRKPNYQRSPLHADIASIRRKGLFARTTRFIFDACESYVSFSAADRLSVCFILLNVFSFLGRLLAPLPAFYFTRKRNIFNDYFVKLGLVWTLVLLAPFIFFTSKVRDHSFWFTCRQLIRLFVVFLLWYAITTIFFNVETWTGVCTMATVSQDAANVVVPPLSSELLDNVNVESPTHRSCVRRGGRWFALEVSGHCFLLVYCAMVIVEEASIFRLWKAMNRITKRRLTPTDGTTNHEEKIKVAVIVQDVEYKGIVNTSFLALNVLLLLWDFMFAVTCLYYHTWVEQLSGFAFAAGCWYLTYGSWYHSANSPGLPGEY